MTEYAQTIPIAEVAQRLHTTPLNVLMHIKRGLLQGCEGESGWQIDRASLESFLAATGGVKASDVCAVGCTAQHDCGGGCG